MKKRVVCLLCILALVATAGCKKDKDKDKEQYSDSYATEAPEPSKDEEKKYIDIGSNTKISSLKDVIESSREKSGESETKYEIHENDNSDIVQLGVDSALASKYAILRDRSGDSIYSIAIIEAKEGNLETITDKLTAYIDRLKNSASGNNSEMLSNSVVASKNNYAILIIAENSRDILSNVLDNIGKLSTNNGISTTPANRDAPINNGIVITSTEAPTANAVNEPIETPYVEVDIMGNKITSADLNDGWR